jgi:hypothetical protein
MGDVGTAIFFTLTLVAEIILTLYVLTYSMHCLQVVTRDTADGNDVVTWPSEPFQDWVGGSLHLVLVVVVCLAPFGLLARNWRPAWLPDDFDLRFLLLAVPGLWLLFPVALLSSLSGSSRWFVLRPVVVWNLLRAAPSTLAAYLLSALLAAAVAALGYVAVVRGWFLLTPVVAAVAAASFLIYARLLGRLGARMGRLPSDRRKAVKRERPKVKGVEVHDPWAAPGPAEAPEEPLPTLETTPFGRTRERTRGYGLAPAEKATPAEAAPPDAPTEPAPAPPPRPDDRPPRSRDKPKRPAAPRGSLLGGVLTFPLYEQSRKAWLLLSLGFLVVGALGCVLAALYARLAAQM